MISLEPLIAMLQLKQPPLPTAISMQEILKMISLAPNSSKVIDFRFVRNYFY